MHIVRHTAQELKVVAGTRWISATCAAAALVTLYFVVTKRQPAGAFLVGFLLLFAVIMDLRKTFTFDAARRVVRWQGRKVFKAESGELRFDEITDILSETRRAGVRDVPVYRLSIVTSRATIPMAYAFSGQSDGYSALRRQLLDFVRHGSAEYSVSPSG